MRKIKLTFLALCLAGASFAQTATNFTATDCNSVSHDLYTELNAGKVVVIEWVMPCSACIGGATAAYNAVQSFATSHPGKVVDYLVDDAGNTSCSSLSSWATTNSMDVAKMTIFGNSPVAIDEANYGGSGMPHVIVIGPDKTILFNQMNSAANNLTAITAAINIALQPASINDLPSAVSKIDVFPNPTNVSSTLQIEGVNTTNAVIQLVDINGKLIQEIYSGSIQKGSNKFPINCTNLANGLYQIKINIDGKIVNQKLTVAQ
ncbi:MAG: T9SS type A sorting domain-containing protein [Bacteriodetes bacterium]|nr:T9SS type A sorting domain-containing protein [Bacteroidota bacterium]